MKIQDILLAESQVKAVVLLRYVISVCVLPLLFAFLIRKVHQPMTPHRSIPIAPHMIPGTITLTRLFLLASEIDSENQRS